MIAKRRSWIALLATLTLAVSMIPMTPAAFAEDAAGLAEENGEYWIRTPEALDDFAAQVTAGNDFAGKVVNLDADITAGADFAGAGVFSSSAGSAKSFNGTLNGNGHKISLALDRSYSSAAGLAVINDLGADGLVKDLTVEGSVKGTSTASGNLYVGGIVAYGRGGAIQNCVSLADVTNNSDSYAPVCAGGIAAYTKGTVSNCRASGNVTGTHPNTGSCYLGGIIGTAAAGSTLSNCTYSSGTVGSLSTEKISYGGGIAGQQNVSGTTTPSFITNCSVNGAVVSGYYAGGIAGSASGRVLNCFSDASVTGAKYTGGITGGTSANTILRNNYFAGTFGGSAVSVGGIFSNSSSKNIAQNNYVAASSVENIEVGSSVFAYKVSTLSSSAMTLTDNATFDAAGNLTWQEGASAITPADAVGSALESTIAITDVTTLLSALQTWQMNSEEGVFASWKAGDPYPVFGEDSTEPEVISGDLDGDGVIGKEDLTTIQKAALGKADLTAEQFAAADFNGDGKITASDVLHLKKLLKAQNA